MKKTKNECPNCWGYQQYGNETTACQQTKKSQSN